MTDKKKRSASKKAKQEATSAQEIFNKWTSYSLQEATNAAGEVLAFYEDPKNRGLIEGLPEKEKKEERGAVRECLKRAKGKKHKQLQQHLRGISALLSKGIRGQVGQTLEAAESEGMPDAEATADEERVSTGKIEQLVNGLASDVNELAKDKEAEEKEKILEKREISEEEMGRRKLLQRFSVSLRKPLKRLFEISDFNPERIEGNDDHHEYARGLISSIQEEIYDVLMGYSQEGLEAIQKLPYREKKQKLEEIKNDLIAFWQDVETTLSMMNLQRVVGDANIYPPTPEITEESETQPTDMPEPEDIPSPPEDQFPPPGTPKDPKADKEREGYVSQANRYKKTIKMRQNSPIIVAKLRSELLDVRQKIKEIDATYEPRGDMPEPPALSLAPEPEEIVNVMEEDKTVGWLIGRLNIIREGFAEAKNYRQTGTPPLGFKNDLDTFNEILAKRKAKSPLAKAKSREELAKAYIDLLRDKRPDLFQHWDKVTFLAEMSKRLKPIFINNKKLLKE